MEEMARILIVDDEPGPREALRELLHPAYQVATATDADDALQAIKTAPTDLILLDLKLPGMNGLDLLKVIKEMDASIEVIMMTAYASLETIRGAMASGASGYLVKPFREGEVEDAVKRVLDRRARHTGGEQEVRLLLAQLLALTQISAADSGALDLSPLSAVLTQAQRLLEASAVVLQTREATGTPFQRGLALHCPPALDPILTSPDWHALLQRCLAGDHPLLLEPEPEVEDSALPPALRTLGYVGGLLFAVRPTPEAAAVLTFLTTSPRPWNPDGVAFAHTVAELLGLVLYTQQRYHAAQQTESQQAQRAAQLDIQRAISQAILGRLELPVILEALSAQLQAGLGYAGFYVWLSASSAPFMQQAYGSGPNLGWQPDEGAALPPGLEVHQLPEAQVVLAPIILQGRAVGVLKLVRQTTHDVLTPVEIDLLHLLLDSIALAVHNSRLYGEVAATKSFLENLVQGAGDAIFTVDLADRITSWNPSAEQLFQVPAARVLQQPVWTILPREPYAQWRTEVERRGKSLQVYTSLKASAGPDRDVLLTFSPLRGPHNTLAGLSAICKDVTEERQLREQVLQAEKLRVVGEMAAGIAHNFNNVLTTILTRAQLLALQITETTSLQRGLNLIAQAAGDGAAIVRRLQTLARGTGTSEVARLDLNTLVQEVVETTQPLWHDHTTREGRPVEVQLDLAPLPQIPARAAELREVLTNLLLNAVEAMPQGGCLTFRTWAEAKTACIAVQDTGVGMTPEVKQRLFDPFFTTKGVRGTGLGLSVSQALIQAHQGTLTVDSELGRGTTFVIRLPIA
jgi:PAS domain S-box-containing protein